MLSGRLSVDYSERGGRAACARAPERRREGPQVGHGRGAQQRVADDGHRVRAQPRRRGRPARLLAAQAAQQRLRALLRKQSPAVTKPGVSHPRARARAGHRVRATSDLASLRGWLACAVSYGSQIELLPLQTTAGWLSLHGRLLHHAHALLTRPRASSAPRTSLTEHSAMSASRSPCAPCCRAAQPPCPQAWPSAPAVRARDHAQLGRAHAVECMFVLGSKHDS